MNAAALFYAPPDHERACLINSWMNWREMVTL